MTNTTRVAELIRDYWPTPQHKQGCNMPFGSTRCRCGMAEEVAARDEALALLGADQVATAKPEPVLQWEDIGGIWKLACENGCYFTVESTGTTRKWYQTVDFTIHDTPQEAMRAAEKALGLPEVPIWKP